MYEYGTITGTPDSPSTTSTSSAAPSASAPPVQPATPTQGVLPTYNGWAYINCFVDAVAARTLPVGMGVTGGPGAMTVPLCVDACKNANYPVAGLE